MKELFGNMSGGQKTAIMITGGVLATGLVAYAIHSRLCVLTRHAAIGYMNKY